MHPIFKYGVNVQPEFTVTQHENGKEILNRIQGIFEGKGTVQRKPGSLKVWEYKLSGVSNLITHIVPFYLEYVIPFSGKVKEFNLFLEILEQKQRKDHLTQEGSRKMVKLAYTLNEYGKGSARKRTLEEVLTIIQDKDSYFANRGN